MTWSRASEAGVPPLRRTGHSCVAVGKCLVIFGGAGNYANSLDTYVNCLAQWCVYASVAHLSRSPLSTAIPRSTTCTSLTHVRFSGLDGARGVIADLGCLWVARTDFLPYDYATRRSSGNSSGSSVGVAGGSGSGSGSGGVAATVTTSSSPVDTTTASTGSVHSSGSGSHVHQQPQQQQQQQQRGGAVSGAALTTPPRHPRAPVSNQPTAPGDGTARGAAAASRHDRATAGGGGGLPPRPSRVNTASRGTDVDADGSGGGYNATGRVRREQSALLEALNQRPPELQSRWAQARAAMEGGRGGSVGSGDGAAAGLESVLVPPAMVVAPTTPTALLQQIQSMRSSLEYVGPTGKCCHMLVVQRGHAFWCAVTRDGCGCVSRTIVQATSTT